MLKCQFCQKEIKSRNHERLCKLNPNYEQNIKNYREKRPQYSVEIKEKIRQTLKSKTYKHICIKCGKEFKSTSSSSNVLCKDCKFKNGFKSKNIGLYKINCKKCNKEIFVKAAEAEYCYECSDKLGYMRFQIYDQNGKKIVSEETKKKNSEISKRLMAEGKIKPWQTRNIKSYAERFFEKVLSLNKIQYTREKKVSKYFLDFVIETPKRIIDFEVDGKQHQTKERIESDKIRDQYLINNGYYVYRLSWNQINTIDGKKEMKKKISDFLLFYHNSF